MYIFFKKHFINKIKKISFGTNSKNFFLLKINNNFFFSLIKNFFLNNVKIIQNKFNFLVKILSNYNNLLLYKKINGVMFFYTKNIICVKISFIIFKLKIKNISKINLNLFFFKNKNFIKFIIKKKKNSNIMSHNDIFKDNILINGNFINSIIDLNNLSFFKYNNDLSNLILEFTENFYFKKSLILENYFLKNKFFLINIYNYLIKILILRKKKIINNTKTKYCKNYLKKIFFK
ncbi:hypothetical protein [Candidatus Carsonella ruddii]|nr:hypothetical protein [Candidatus Carsonella ruddii]